MERRQSTNQLAIRKLNTLSIDRKDEWSLPSGDKQCLKVLLWLGLANKMSRLMGKKIRKSVQKIEKQRQYILKTYLAKQHNTVDVITPQKNKIAQVKQHKQYFKALRNDVNMFFRQMKPKQNKSKRIQTLTQIDFQLPTIKPQMLLTPKKQQKKQVLSKTSYRQKLSLITSTYNQNNFKYIQNSRKTEQNKISVMNASRLKVRLKNENQMFKKFNCTLSKYYQSSSIKNTIKSSFQLISLFLNSMFQLKNCVNSRLDHELNKNPMSKQRVMYEIVEMVGICDQIKVFFKDMVKMDHMYVKKYENVQKFFKQSKKQQDNNQRSQQMINLLKNLDFMIEITKMIINIPDTAYLLKKRSSNIVEMFEKMSQFRYLSRYLCMQVGNMAKSIALTEQNENQKENKPEEYTQKWKIMFNRKFKPLKPSLKNY